MQDEAEKRAGEASAIEAEATAEGAPEGAVTRAAGPDGRPFTGHALIRHLLPTLPHRPGVYRMLDEKGAVLYVGKARDLRKRVASYARPTGHGERIRRMIAATHGMMFLTTGTEAEALLLEQSLIKQLKPRFNVLLRDDKSFPEILVTRDHPFPRIVKHRGKRRVKGHYFGPFASAAAVNRTLNQLQKMFLLRNCTDAVFEGRTRPCLLYQIRRCAGPCAGKVSEAEYAGLVADAEKFLSGRSHELQARLAREMEAAAARLDYERAAVLRDRIRALSEVQATQIVNPRGIAEADVVALALEGGEACVQVFFIRGGQNWGNRAFFPRTGAGAGAAEILEAFLAQFYGRRPPPREIILSDAVANPDLLAELLAARREGRVRLTVPRRGVRADLVAAALRNAREALARRQAETASQVRLLERLSRIFELPAPPERIEVYDNSHIQGAHAVGAMIVAGPEGFIRSAYRRFNIRAASGDDDFAMMREVLTRRFSRLVREDPRREGGNWPDLLLIDGGKGQLSAAREALAGLGIDDLPLVAVAKGEARDAGREIFHRPGRPPLALRHDEPALHFIQRLRDEAHRFAIGSHRRKRAGALGRSPLDEIPGVGPARKRALLAHFGSAKAVADAPLADLKVVKGISRQLAETIYAHFHDE